MNKKILVVDDDEGIVDAVTMVLTGAGYTVDTCLNAKDIYKKINLFHPNVIILDVLLSGEDGREIYAKLKQDEPTKHIPIIIISAHHYGKKSIQLVGADEFLEKPFERGELLEKIERGLHVS